MSAEHIVVNKIVKKDEGRKIEVDAEAIKISLIKSFRKYKHGEYSEYKKIGIPDVTMLYMLSSKEDVKPAEICIAEDFYTFGKRLGVSIPEKADEVNVATKY